MEELTYGHLNLEYVMNWLDLKRKIKIKKKIQIQIIFYYGKQEVCHA
jgi:hypothetical protein